MAVETFRVALQITQKCNIACDHCWLSSGPERTAQMDIDEALGYIDQARELGTVEWISLTGGEPFLLHDMLKALIAYAHERGFHTECVTNCFWASTVENAEEKLKQLVDAGLDVINISADDFHQRHIPFARVRNCYLMAKQLGLRIVVMCALSRSSMLKIGEISRLLNGERIAIASGYGSPEGALSLAVETGFIPVGRGKTLPEHEQLIGCGSLVGSCKTVLRDIVITPSGEVMPCCSASGLTKAAKIGNARERRLIELLKEAHTKKLFRILSREGPMGLWRCIGPTPLESFVNKCHFCYEVLMDSRLSRFLGLSEGNRHA
jgi:hypothetical protein